MPNTLIPPRPAPVAEEEPALYVCVWDHVARVVAWLDAANGRGPHETAVRIMKIAGEVGEAVAAYIGATGTPARASPPAPMTWPVSCAMWSWPPSSPWPP